MPHSNRSRPKLKANQTIAFEAIGTAWHIEIFDAPVGKMQEIEAKIRERIAIFDKVYSRFRSDSLVTRISKEVGAYTVPDDARSLLDFYRTLYDLTDGAVTPLIGNTISDAGYDASYSLNPKSLSRPVDWDTALYYEHPKLHVRTPVLLDFGAAGKGYLIDLVGALLQDNKLHNYCINAGGDLVYHTTSAEPLEIALEHPDDPTLAIGVARISNQSLCGSAGNRRAWGQFHHIIDPYTLTSPQHIKALWVVAENGIIADGLATALFFVKPETLRSTFDFAYAIINADYSLTRSSNFPADFYNE